MVWRTLGRLILIPIELAVAAALAGLVLVTLGLERFTQAAQGRGDDALGTAAFTALYELILQGHSLASGLTLIPTLAVVIIGEVARIRSSLYYMLGGGLALVAIPLLAKFGETGSVAAPATIVWQVFATAGFVGGWVYWLLAGRNA